MVKPHHDVCRITDAALTREALAYELGQQAYLDRMLYDKSTENPFRNNVLDAKEWQRGFSTEYADYIAAITNGVRMIGFKRSKK